MSADTQDRISAKLFIGMAITSELKMHLNESSLWHNAKAQATDHPDELSKVTHEGHEYIGCYVGSERVALPALQDYSIHLQHQIKRYCPDFDIHKLKACIFSQIFIC